MVSIHDVMTSTPKARDEFQEMWISDKLLLEAIKYYCERFLSIIAPLVQARFSS